jgi:hypothetical protein
MTFSVPQHTRQAKEHVARVGGVVAKALHPPEAQNMIEKGLLSASVQRKKLLLL